MRKTREPKEQSIGRILVRILLPIVLKIVIFQLLGKAIQRSIEMTEEIDRKRYGLEMDAQRIQNESRLKDAAYGSSYGRVEARS